MPKSKKEGILFSFLMSAVMIFFMAELNYGVRTGDFARRLGNTPLPPSFPDICSE